MPSALLISILLFQHFFPPVCLLLPLNSSGILSHGNSETSVVGTPSSTTPRYPPRGGQLMSAVYAGAGIRGNNKKKNPTRGFKQRFLLVSTNKRKPESSFFTSSVVARKAGKKKFTFTHVRVLRPSPLETDPSGGGGAPRNLTRRKTAGGGTSGARRKHGSRLERQQPTNIIPDDATTPPLRNRNRITNTTGCFHRVRAKLK